MRLIVGSSGRVIDVENAVRCPMCREWFVRGSFPTGYCRRCWNDYQRWRCRLLTLERRNEYRVVYDVSIRAFRDLYMNDMLGDIIPWTHSAVVEAPLGALDVD
jgi:hypothetical protein